MSQNPTVRNLLELEPGHWFDPDDQNVLFGLGGILERRGFDGLYTDNCGCEIGDLCPCGQPEADTCQAGHKVPCGGPETCAAGGDCDWHIGPERSKE